MSGEGAAFSFADHHKEKASSGMDMTVARDNLFAIADVLDGAGLKYFLFFGTLLGAIRERGFIAHDTDTDLGVFREFSDRFAEVRTAAEALGFKVLRGEPGGRLFSFMRGNEYLDCYVAERRTMFPLRRAWDVDGSLVPYRSLSEPDTIEFLGRTLTAPSNAERVLETLYGKNWRIPVVRAPAKPRLWRRITRFLREPDKRDALRRHLRIARASRGKKGRNGL